jgi:hypothetical protein
MDMETVLFAVDRLIYSKTGKHLSTLQTAIFRGSWQGQKYDEIAQMCSCSDTHIKMVGADLWEILSLVLDERVTKKTFRATLERHGQSLTVPSGSEHFSSWMSDKAYCALSRAHLELPEGQIKLSSRFYIERPPLEALGYQTVLEPGSLIHIKAPCQMGKTSLMTRILHHAVFQHYHSVPLNLRLVDSKIWQDSDRFLRWVCANVGRSLQLPNQIAAYWDDSLGSKISCHDYFKDYLLSQIEQPLVLALDEVEYLFQHPAIADDVFALLQVWHEEAKNQSRLDKLRLVLVHSTETYALLKVHQPLFNMGLTIEPRSFLLDEVLELVYRHGLSWTRSQAENLMKLIGGHPYLIRLALYYLVRENISVELFLQLASTETGPYRNHLYRVLGNLAELPKLTQALKLVVNSTSPVRLDPLDVLQLYNLGVISLEGNEAVLRCELYRQYFQDRLQQSY